MKAARAADLIRSSKSYFPGKAALAADRQTKSPIAAKLEPSYCNGTKDAAMSSPDVIDSCSNRSIDTGRKSCYCCSRDLATMKDFPVHCGRI